LVAESANLADSTTDRCSWFWLATHLLFSHYQSAANVSECSGHLNVLYSISFSHLEVYVSLISRPFETFAPRELLKLIKG
jgi:hypothetical protein